MRTKYAYASSVYLKTIFIQDMARQVNLLGVALLMTYEVSPSWMVKKPSCFHADKMLFETLG